MKTKYDQKHRWLHVTENPADWGVTDGGSVSPRSKKHRGGRPGIGNLFISDLVMSSQWSWSFLHHHKKLWSKRSQRNHREPAPEQLEKQIAQCPVQGWGLIARTKGRRKCQALKKNKRVSVPWYSLEEQILPASDYVFLNNEDWNICRKDKKSHFTSACPHGVLGDT